MEQWLSVDQIGNHLGVSKETIYRMLYSKKIPATKVGKLWKFKASIVDQAMEKKSLQSTKTIKQTVKKEVAMKKGSKKGKGGGKKK